MAKRHWLVKTEADCYSIDDFRRDRRVAWSGIRNYQARNFMRDGMRVGDPVLFHHSNGDPSGVVGVARVAREAHPDVTALDPKDEHHDPKATPAAPIWLNVDLAFVEKFPRVISLAELKKIPALAKMGLLRPGQRLSVMPVTAREFTTILARSRKGSS